MKARELGTNKEAPCGPVGTSRLGGRGSRAGLGVLVALGLFVGWCGLARAESGAILRGTGAGLKMDIDTRWVSGAGYRPVRITVTPVTPVIADRTLTVELGARHFWNYSGDDLRVVQDIEIPAGSGVVETTISVPQTAGWNAYTINVLDDGKLRPRLCQSGAGDQYTAWAWEEKFPKVLIVGDTLPDTTGIAVLLNVSEYYQYQPAVSPVSGQTPLPTAIARPAAELPRRWIDYTNLDLVCISVEQLAGLARRQPETLRTIVEWTFAGGNLCVYGVGRDWSRLAELESLVGLAPGTADTASAPAARGWTEPDEKLFSRPLRGVGSSVTHPFAASAYSVAPGAYAVAGTYGGASYVVTGGEPKEVEEEDIPAEQLQPAGCLPFVFRPFQMGMIVALADEDPFEMPVRRASLGWSWMLNSIGSKRFLWYQRHGMSAIRENEQFWNFLIPGVGLAPVTAFRVLITLFVLGIGPLNYLLLRRWKSLHLLVVTVPLSAAAVTLALFGYAIVADGMGTRVRVRSITEIDQRRGHAACWSRLSYYAGVAPFGGLTFPEDVAVIPFEYVIQESGSRTRELVWEEDQRLTRGWLRSRTPTQFITVRSRPSRLGLSVTPSEEDPGVVRVENRLGTPIEQLLVRADDGRYYWAADVPTGAAAKLPAIEPEDARRRLDQTFGERQPAYPVGMDRGSRTSYSTWRSYRRPWYWVANQANIPPASQQTGLLETTLENARAATLEPRSYVAIVARSPEVEIGTSSAREEAGFHVILGTW